MKHVYPIIIIVFTSSVAFANNGASKPEKIAEQKKSNLLQKLNENGIQFTPNKGQIVDRDGKLRPDVLFQSAVSGSSIYLRKTGVSYVFSNTAEVNKEIAQQIEQQLQAQDGLGDKTKEQLEQELHEQAKINVQQIDVDFLACNNNPTTISEGMSSAYSNFYHAHCSEGINGVKQYEQVTYQNVYDKIDVRYYGNPENGLEYDLIVQPHADPGQIRLSYTGANNIELVNNRLQISTFLGKLEEYMPKVYQNIEGEVIDIEAQYVLTKSQEQKAGIVTFDLDEYNPNYPLIIDPWVTYVGGWGNFIVGTGSDVGTGVTTDAIGNVYVSGSTSSNTAISFSGFQNVYGGNTDAFLLKFDEAGVLLWATYYGGTGYDQASDIAIDVSNNIYIAGTTTSATAIAFNGFQNVTAGLGDAFLAKFDGSGTRLWATYYGGVDREYNGRVATDNFGNVYLAGHSVSDGLASGGFQNTRAGDYDAFVVKFDNGGTRLWATCYGGTLKDEVYGVATDPAGDVIICGMTYNTTGIAFNGFQNVFGGGLVDAYVVKFGGGGGTRQWASYLGGIWTDKATAIEADGAGNIYFVGSTNSPTGIASGGFQTVIGASGDGFVTKVNTSGALQWSTYLGGDQADYANSIDIDEITNNVFVSGDTYSSDFPTSQCAIQPNIAGLENAFVTQFLPTGDIFCSSYFGANHEEDSKIAVHGCYIYLTGASPAGLGVTPGAHQTTFGHGFSDAYVAQIYKSTCGISLPVLTLNPSQNNGTSCSTCDGSATVNVSSTCNNNMLFSYVWSTGFQLVDTTLTSTTLTGLCPGEYWVEVSVNTCDLKDTAFFTITGNSANYPIPLLVSKVDETCTLNDGSATIAVNAGTGVAPYIYNWSNGSTGPTVNNLSSGTHEVMVTDNNGCKGILNVIIFNANAPSVSLVSKTDEVCSSGNGAATVAAIAGSGIAPYTYSWSNGDTGPTATNLSAGTYQATVTDATGCKGTLDVIIGSSTNGPTLSLSSKTDATCSSNNGTATVSVNTGTGTSPFTISWSNGDTGPTANNLTSGTHQATVTDAAGCIGNLDIIIGTTPLTTTFSKGTTSGCASCGCKEWAMVNATSGTAPFTYSWSGLSAGQARRYQNKLCPGNYNVTVTDSNGCSEVVSLSIP